MIYTFFSRVLNCEREYQVLLPEEYAESNQSYPVLYMLHGKEQNHYSWTKYTFLEVVSPKYPYIFIMPEGDDVWYLEYKHGYEKIQLYIKELVNHVDTEFRTMSHRGYRGICGISMGGYAAFLTAFNNPDLFGSVSALSGVLNITNHLNDGLLKYGLPLEKKAWDDLNIFVLAEKIIGTNLYILFDSGINDDISYKDSVELSGELSRLAVQHVFNRYDGGHDWYYWDDHLEEHLKFFRKHFFNKEG